MSEKIQSISDLFEHELQDIYDAEKKLVEALGKLARESTDPEVRGAFETHREETQGQAERVEKVFRMLNREASRGEGCAGIDGLLEEKKNFTRHDPSREILQIFNLGVAMKTERYEITAYEGLILLAESLELHEAVDLLQQNLDQEEAALEKLQTFAEEPPVVTKAIAHETKGRVKSH